MIDKDIPTRIAEIEARAKRQGLPIAHIYRRAMVNASTWTRWRSGQTNPIYRTWVRVEEAVDDLLEDTEPDDSAVQAAETV